MKILHLSYSDFKGGASRAVKRIHESLLPKVDSNLIVNLSNEIYGNKNIFGPKNIFFKYKNLLRAAVGTRLGLLLRSDNFVIHSLGVLPSNFSKFINKSDFDIINLHWIGGEMISIEDIGKIKKPIVWTLHDMWPFCGAEHFTLDDRWKYGYFKSNKKKNEKYFDLKRFCWDRKVRSWKKKMNIVGVSDWISNCASDSSLMCDWPNRTINNTLDTNFWKPESKSKAREFFNLPMNIKIFGYGSLGYKNSSLKGKDLFLSAIKHIKHDKKKFGIFFLGEGNDFADEINGIKIFKVDRLDNDNEIKHFYNAIDFVVVPSRLESFGQTASEAHSCGKPVVAFKCTGLTDIIKHKINGWLAEPFDISELATGIDYILDLDEVTFKKYCQDSRNMAEKKFSYEVISKKYIELYKDILSKKNNND